MLGSKIVNLLPHISTTYGDRTSSPVRWTRAISRDVSIVKMKSIFDGLDPNGEAAVSLRSDIISLHTVINFDVKPLPLRNVMSGVLDN